MRYAMARYKESRREVAYRIYVTDCLRMITENTAAMVNGVYTTKRYFDCISERKEEVKPGEEILADVIQKAGLVMVKDESV